ncbi:hypothetical protein GCM10025883_29350 [Mobilicoccus caccae]|uniref:Serine protease PepD n=2 Tax=Mobilicoccus caccae TaxID=1859295 RepID=A0ABQ6IU30_9MICO|nr:hypothetical protein GCM10025883_29350 [Mobilicoccus caccae]
MQRIEGEATRMSGLVEDLLTLARLDNRRPMQMEPIDLTVIAGDVVQDARARDTTHTLRLTGLAGQRLGPATVDGDDARLRQVVTNLVANALQHTPAGTSITVSVGTEDDRCRVEVADNGPGVAPEAMPHLFERFYRTDPARGRQATGGHGLGLAIVAAIAQAHGGRTGVAPTPGGGATFVLDLPVPHRPLMTCPRRCHEQHPELPHGSPEPTWHSEPHGPASGQAPVWESPQQQKPPRKRRRGVWVVLAVMVLVIALLGTAAMMTLRSGVQTSDFSQNSGLPQGADAPRAPVEQADASAPDWSATAAAVSPSVVSIAVASGRSGGEGSGVVFDSEGHVLTNHHVVAAAGNGGTILVTLADKRVFEAKIDGSDAATDLAVLSLQGAPEDLRPISAGDDRQLKVGQPVMAIGNPLGLSGTVTTGIVSALNRPVSTTQESQGQNPFGGQQQGELVVTNAIQTSAAINPGNSGGALVDASGKLVGINSSIASLSQQSGNIGIGFAIPVTEAQAVAKQLMESGKVKHPYLGVRLTDAIATEGQTKRRAAGIASVETGTPAAAGGLRDGDAVIAIDGTPVDSSLSLTAQVRARTVGTPTKLTILRDGQRQDIQVNLAERN